MSKPVLRVQDLAVRFTSRTGGLLQSKEREVRAVDGISFELSAGETLGVVGESGSGKSTLARAILGLIRPNRGRVQWMGEDLTGLDEEALVVTARVAAVACDRCGHRAHVAEDEIPRERFFGRGRQR